MSENQRLRVIGWREWIAVPGLNIKSIKAKIDTGARSSSIHAFNIETYQNDGTKWVRFDIHPRQRCDDRIVQATAPVHDVRMVRPSTGEATERIVILTPIRLLGDLYDIELTLANRDQMGFRMLLGREAFRNRFLVHAGLSYRNGRPKRKINSSDQSRTSP